MSGVLYFCEALGARIFLANSGLSQQGTDYQASVTTWDIIPQGEVGDVYWRSIDVSGIADAGYSIGVTPIVDGVAQAEQLFNGAAAGEFTCQAFISVRGTRIAATVRTVTRSGAIELHNIACAYVPIRRTP